ncbi:MAG TPA: hypothetical protein VD906_02080 [Caulobacteraceae bacterium]|nr:hypothetical protein [Caulobacteraceae bacterium]
MPDKHPNTERWGGPGASHEDRTKPKPDPVVKDATDPDRQQPYSHVSGGGGETDRHHDHHPTHKRRKQENDVQKSMD